MSFLTAAYAVSKKLGVTTEANNLTDKINAINDSIGAEHGVNAEDALNNYAKAMAPITPITTGVTVAPLDDTIDLWGHKASDLQEDITITGWDPSQKRTGSLRFLRPLEMRPSSIAPHPVESREAPTNSTVSLSSQRHNEKLPEVTGTSRGTPGFSAVTRERPRECFKMC